jgi:membrane-associated phospholipid phosphatase
MGRSSFGQKRSRKEGRVVSKRNHLVLRALIGFFVFAVACVFDRSVYLPLRAVLFWESWGEMREGLMAAKFLGSGLGTAVIALVVGVLDRRHRRRVVVFVLVVVSASVLGSGLKVIAGRERPSHLDQLPGEERIAFHGPSRGLKEAPFRSFPSGHTLTAFASATCLSAFYPPAKVVFYAVASATGVNRVVKHQHFPSDVVAGALIGHFAALLLLGRPWIRAWISSHPIDSEDVPT